MASFKRDEEKPTGALLRVKMDITELSVDPPDGIFIAPEESDYMRIYALIVGPRGTPYENAILLFHLVCPGTYPIQPPSLRFITTGCRAGIHPYFYTNGNVSLSILGTYAGPQWSSAQTLSSLLLSVQSLLTEEPYYDHPFKRHLSKLDEREAAQDYNTFVKYEVMRGSLCNAVECCLDNSSCYPAALREKVLKVFLNNYTSYERSVTQDKHLSGKMIRNPFSGNLGLYEHDTLLEQLKDLKRRAEATMKSKDLA